MTRGDYIILSVAGPICWSFIVIVLCLGLKVGLASYMLAHATVALALLVTLLWLLWTEKSDRGGVIALSAGLSAIHVGITCGLAGLVWPFWPY